jgi:hypothetical protein
VQPGDAHVHDEPGPAAEVRGGEFGLPGDRPVGCARRDHDDQAAHRPGNRRRPGEQPGLRVVEGVAEFGQHGLGVRRAGPGEQRRCGRSGLRTQGAGDGTDLLRVLALAVDRLGIAAAADPVVVEVGQLA